MPVRAFSLLSIMLMMVVSGCRCPSERCAPCTGKVAIAHETGVAEAVMPDVSALAAKRQPLPVPGEQYHLLDEFECQRTAVANDYLARLLNLEQHLATVYAECETKNTRRNLRLQKNLLALYAADKRGLAGSNAMVAFYYLAGLETSAPLLDHVIQETSMAADRAARLVEQDLEADIDPTELDRELLQLQDRRAEVDLRRVELNGQLQRLLGSTLQADAFYWPQVQTTVEVDPIDVDAAVALGLAERQDLRMIRLVMCNLDEETLPVVQAFLGALDGALGTATVQEGCIHRLRCIACSDHEVPVRCRQLRILLDDAERAVTTQIRLAAFEVQSHYARIAIAREVVASWEQRVARLEAKRSIEGTTVFEIGSAQIELYQAQIDLVQHVTQLRLAKLALRQAQGLLPGESGYAPIVCCPPCDGQPIRASP